MTTRELPLTKRYPGEHVARLKLWFPDTFRGKPDHSSVSFAGQIYPELARLIVALILAKRDPAVLAKLDAIATELSSGKPAENHAHGPI